VRRRYLAVAIIGALSITSGFLVGAVTADRTIVIITIGTMSVIIGAGLLFTVRCSPEGR
jgi:hypothetical protein